MSNKARRGTVAERAGITFEVGELCHDTDVPGSLRIGDGVTVGGVPVVGSEVNDLTASVTWANIPDANVPQTAVTQHQAALAITESQISDLGTYLSNVVEDTTPQLGGALDVQANAINTSTVNGSITLTPNGTGDVVLGNFTLDADQSVGVGQDDYVLTYDNATGKISLEASTGGGGGLNNVVEDTTPQLGGNLDVQANVINTSTVNGGITLTPNGTGNVTLGNFTFDADQTVGAGQDNYILTYDNGTGLISLEVATGGGGASELSDLSDVNTSTPTNRNVLVADGVDWESRALVEADISDLGTYLTTVQDGDVDTEAALDGQVLTSDGAGNAAWETPASGVTDHTLLTNIGTNTHAQIDTHIADSTIHSTVSTTETLTNKTIDGDNNTLSNLDIGNEVDWPTAADVTDATAFASGDKLLIHEAGVGLRKIDFDDLPSSARERLTANRTYYVDPTNGSDSNDGLTVSTEFATVQKAVDVVSGDLDIATFDVTIQLQNDTYTEAVMLKPFIGSGEVTISGDTTTPSNVVMDTLTGTLGTCIDAVEAGLWFVEGIQFTTNAIALRAEGASHIKFNDVDFDAATSFHIAAYSNALVTATGDYEISGNAGNAHWYAIQGGVIAVFGVTITLTGTPNFGVTFCWSNEGTGNFRVFSNTFSGSGTGKRYDLNLNSTCFTNGGGATYLPGNSAGTTATGAQYA